MTAGATLVTATQNQYTFSGAIGLVRVVPTVSWLDPRDRTSIDFSGSFGKITQPAYTNPGPPPTAVAAVTTKTAIYHADAERDEYFSPRFFALGQTAFDHNFGQDLDLQQIYGGGMGWTAIKTPRQELDVKATMQYEKQQFIRAQQAQIRISSARHFLRAMPCTRNCLAIRKASSSFPHTTTPRRFRSMRPMRLRFPHTRVSASRWERWKAF